MRASAGGRKSVTGAPNLGEREYAQIGLAKAEAQVRAARAFFYESIEVAWRAPSRRAASRVATRSICCACRRPI
ncbi:hypothetical protein [Salinicola tamaricis]|uniref:hypothetical protein n=1 Tax=Salinicola tamaricis TaxID=1771309 RepID=UPI001F5C926F|nr:hypothetical protein [Salinicola tamaricis]